MAISRVSRYQRNTTSLVVDRHGNRQLAIMRRAPVSQTVRVMDTLWQAGDRVDLLANRYFGSAQEWWVIAETNPQVLDWTAPAQSTPVMVPRAVA
jgi:hypothetical protein